MRVKDKYISPIPHGVKMDEKLQLSPNHDNSNYLISKSTSTGADSCELNNPRSYVGSNSDIIDGLNKNDLNNGLQVDLQSGPPNKRSRMQMKQSAKSHENNSFTKNVTKAISSCPLTIVRAKPSLVSYSDSDSENSNSSDCLLESNSSSTNSNGQINISYHIDNDNVDTICDKIASQTSYTKSSLSSMRDDNSNSFDSGEDLSSTRASKFNSESLHKEITSTSLDVSRQFCSSQNLNSLKLNGTSTSANMDETSVISLPSFGDDNSNKSIDSRSTNSNSTSASCESDDDDDQYSDPSINDNIDTDELNTNTTKFERLMTMFIRLQLHLTHLNDQKLIPFKANALLKLVNDCVERFESTDC